ncbi:MAG TPA: TasA family protein [Marmoricola sp.]
MRTRKHLTKIAATVALVAGAAGVAGVGTFGAYTDTTAAETKVDSGRVDVRMNGFEKGISITKSNMAAGDVVRSPITLERQAGSLKLSALTMTTSTSGALASTLILTVEKCTAQVPADASTCAGSTTPLYNGPLSAANVTNMAVPADWLQTLNSDTEPKIYLRVSLTLPGNAPDTTQGTSATLNVSLAGTQRTAETTAVTPVQIP